jgi:excisionase family DNA binding protein
MTSLLTTSQAAAALGISPRRCRQLIEQGRLPASRVGRDWLIDANRLTGFQLPPKGWVKGRARKAA